MADLVKEIREGLFLKHKGTESPLIGSDGEPTDLWVWNHVKDGCLGCRCVSLVDALVAAMDYRPCVRFDIEPCRSRPEIPESEWCAMCRAWELREQG